MSDLFGNHIVGFSTRWLIFVFFHLNQSKTLRKLAYAIYRFVSAEKNECFIGISNIFAQNIDCGYTLEPPQIGRYAEYQQSMF